MADRYYSMAENMNTRGAMEMAVPFYRQAITLLLAERASLQQKLGGASAQPVVQGLLMSCMACWRPLKRWASRPPLSPATDVPVQAAPGQPSRGVD